MDFGRLLHTAQKNETSKKEVNNLCYHFLDISQSFGIEHKYPDGLFCCPLNYHTTTLILG